MILTPSCEQSRFSADVAGGCVRALGMITSRLSRTLHAPHRAVPKARPAFDAICWMANEYRIGTLARRL